MSSHSRLQAGSFNAVLGDPRQRETVPGALTYAQACADPNLFAPWFTGTSWDAWRVIDKALFGQALDAPELTIWRELSGRATAPTEPATEAWIIAGRRSGKDVKAASLVTYLATIGAELFNYRSRLVPGERGVVQLLAVDRDQARVALDYVKAFFTQPILAQLVRKVTAERIELTNSLAIEITTNDRRRVRGRTVIAAVLDEVAHWRSDESANPDADVYASIRPAMATIPNALLIAISSPHARAGLLWRKYQDDWGRDGRTLVVKAPTWVMNPNVGRDSEIVVDAYRDDPAWAAAEFGGEFRTDIETFVSIEAVEAVTSKGVRERAPIDGTMYYAFVDPSGGQSDSMTMAVGHLEDEKAVLDLVREIRPPFSPEETVTDFCDTLRRYRVPAIRGDRYGAMWVKEQFTKRGVSYWASEKSKSDLYVSLLPAINSKQVDFIELDRLAAQLITLERRVVRGGRDSIDHPVGGRDDVANAVAGVVHSILGVPDMTVSLIPPMVIRGGEVVDNAALPSWLRPNESRVDLNDEFPGRRLA